LDSLSLLGGKEEVVGDEFGGGVCGATLPAVEKYPESWLIPVIRRIL
jgi:hypothetical protein